MTEKYVVMRDEKTFQNRITYRELTYKLSSMLLEEGQETDDALQAKLWGMAKEVQPAEILDIEKFVHDRLGLVGYELSKVETYLIPETVNTVWRGIATKDGQEVRFYVERP